MQVSLVLPWAFAHLETLFLFTRSDYKTIFVPVCMFATAAAPATSLARWVKMLMWVWTHLLQANVSNQTLSADEDIINKPWRPLPSKRVTPSQAKILRWCLVFFNLALSTTFRKEVVYASAALALVEFVHDDLGWSHYPFLKNFCNVGGYTTFETGATYILAHDESLDSTAISAIVLSALVIFTTIHAQDFADCEGDRQSGRRTLPIVAPEGSRLYILTALVMWSMWLSVFWELGVFCTLLLSATGTSIGIRYYGKRIVHEDERSYRLYNLWLAAVHLLPANSRMRVLAW